MAKKGKPLILKTPEECQIAINKYFQKCENAGRYPCFAQLAYELGIDRRTIYNYEKRDAYFHIIKNARSYIIAKLEEKLINTNQNCTGAIFIAKQYGYRDKQEIEHNITNYKNISKELQEIAKND